MTEPIRLVMRNTRGVLAGPFLLLCSVALIPRSTDLTAGEKECDVAIGRDGVLSTDSAVATEVGRAVLAGGGNAVDAAVAVGFAMAVTWPEAGNIGGGGFMLVAPPGDSEVACIDYRETAPASVNEDSFRDWKLRRHARMAGVPGTVRGLEEAHRRFGSRPWNELLAPAIDLAAFGVTVDGPLAESLNAGVEGDELHGAMRHREFLRTFAHPEKRPWQAGDRLVQRDLAKTLRLIAEDPDEFYRGRVARQIVAEMRVGEGMITATDLEDYRAVVRTPVRGTVAGYEVFGPPPPSSGGLTVLLQLQMLERLSIPRRDQTGGSVRETHLLTETMRRAFRERAAHLGDPDFGDINTSAFSPEAADRYAGLIDATRATLSDAIAAEIPLTPRVGESEQTTHFSVLDAGGMAVSNTYTLEASFGSKVVVRGAGFLLNNEMGDFNWVSGVTNRRGQIGTRPNLMAPGKRMLSSMSPTIVKEDGEVRLIVGSPGGRTIINTVTQVTAAHLLAGRDLAKCVTQPRTHHQWLPDVLFLEGDAAEWPAGFADELRLLGHDVQHRPTYRQGSVHAIAVDATGTATAVADWRRGGAAAAVESPPVE